ncbi:hypothetical protein EGJ34_02855 [Stenotrophomonas sp. 278]|nr:hypothetical protein EGJ34_02855 [Stenotrophomonas sp. 278]
MTFCAGALLAWALLADHPSNLDASKSSSDLPAWVQAIGSIVGILIAVAVPAAQHRISAAEKRKDADNRARSLGLQLLPHIQRMIDQNNKIWDKEHPDDQVEDRSENSCILGDCTRDALTVPGEILEEVGRLHELGDAAEGIQRAIYNLARANELLTYEQVTRQMVGYIRVGPEQVIFDKSSFYDLMWDALRGLSQSQSRIEGYFEHSRRPGKRNAG